jgi:hypothetical protein
MVRGSCLCGGIAYEADEVPLIVLCHCSQCRKATGSAFEAGAPVPAGSFRLLKGADLIQRYESSPGNYRAFCRVCGSRAPGPSKDGRLYYVHAGTFDDDPGTRPALHMMVGSKAPWWEIGDALPRFEEFVPGYGPADEPG